MIKNYLKTALRNIFKQKVYSLINISGLALGLAFFILSALYADFNFSFDEFHENSDRIYMLDRISANGRHGLFAPAPMLAALVTEVPEVEDGIRMMSWGGRIVRYKDKQFYESHIRFVDNNFFKFFSFDLVTGDPEHVLSNPNSIVITREIAEKYFGDEDPIGKDLIFDNEFTATVTGISENNPKNSTIRYNFVLSIDRMRWLHDWDSFVATFVRLSRGTGSADIKENLNSLIEKNMAESEYKPKDMELYPLTGLWFQPMGFSSMFPRTTPIQYYIIFGLAAALLLVVCINFMNLSTSRFINRAREVGMRKVAGAYRGQLIRQFLGESLLISLLALPVAVGVFMLVRPAFLAIMGPNLEISLWNNPMLIVYLVIVTFIVGIISGSYPAFFMSAFRPVQVLRGNLQASRKGITARKILVVSQFSLTVILIIFTVVTEKQFGYLVTVDLGYDRDNVIAVELHDDALGNLEAFKKELLGHPGIISTAGSGWIPGDWGNSSGNPVLAEGMDEKDAVRVNAYPAEYDYIETLGMTVIEGRSFSKEFTDSSSFIISASLARDLRLDEPLGKRLTYGRRKGRIVGVVKDFHFKHVFHKSMPAMFFFRDRFYSYLMVKVSPENKSEAVAFIGEQWHRTYPNLPYESTTLDSHFKYVFNSTVKGKEFISSFSVLAIFISCLGLLGLASYTVSRRTKEIGIRKVLGASVPGIIKMLILEFFLLVALSNLIAWPIGYFLANWFLNWAWAVKTGIGIGIFVLAAAVSLFTATAAVISQTIKAARANPVKSLRIE